MKKALHTTNPSQSKFVSIIYKNKQLHCTEVKNVHFLSGGGLTRTEKTKNVAQEKLVNIIWYLQMAALTI